RRRGARRFRARAARRGAARRACGFRAFRSRLMARKNRLKSEINVVPYIDVMLVLLIIFMVTAPLLTQGIEVDLPDGAAEALPPEESEPLVVSIDREGRLYLNIGEDPEAPLDEERLLEMASAVFRRNP